MFLPLRCLIVMYLESLSFYFTPFYISILRWASSQLEFTCVQNCFTLSKSTRSYYLAFSSLGYIHTDPFSFLMMADVDSFFSASFLLIYMALRKFIESSSCYDFSFSLFFFLSENKAPVSLTFKGRACGESRASVNSGFLLISLLEALEGYNFSPLTRRYLSPTMMELRSPVLHTTSLILDVSSLLLRLLGNSTNLTELGSKLCMTLSLDFPSRSNSSKMILGVKMDETSIKQTMEGCFNLMLRSKVCEMFAT